jgi:hypothetical protein
MKVRFLTTTGMLSDRLMAALQGAKVPGADTRCLAGGRSSISAFIRVAKPEDTTGVLFLHLNVNNAPEGVDPIDSLQVLYDEWRGGLVHVQGAGPETPQEITLAQNYPNPFNGQTRITYTIESNRFVVLRIYDLLGREVTTLVNGEEPPGVHSVIWDAAGLSGGVYHYRLEAGGTTKSRKLVLLR